MRRKIAIGNWKMFGLSAALDEISTIDAQISQSRTDVVICPPFPLLFAAQSRAQTAMIGAQDCHTLTEGAYTGNVSAAMIADTGASFVLCGHSERRRDCFETNALVAAKAQAAHAAGLVAVVCVGESLADREAGTTLEVIAQEVSASLPEVCTGTNTVIGYEPLWAIGTGLIPSPAQIGEVHDCIRRILCERFGAEGDAIRIVYGGSVKASNAAEIFAASNVDGALVGGASLKAVDFLPIITALDAA